MEKYRYTAQEQSMLEHLRQPFAVYQFVDRRVVTLILSDGFCQLFGYEDRAKAYYDMDNDMYRDAHPDDVARIANAAFRFATEGGKYEVIYRTKTRGSSHYRIVHAYGEHVFTDTGVRLAHVWYSDEGLYQEERGQQGSGLNQSLSDALHENSIVKANQYDYLTGLPSMTYFFELAESGKERILEKGGNPVLMYIDFSGMKFYNTKYGFAEGDRLLQSFAKILAGMFGNEHSCRIGADHFAVQSEEAGLDEKLQRLFAECKELNGRKTLPIHVGIYVSQPVQVHTSVACDRAKMACNALSGRYGMAVKYYSQELNDDVEKRQYIIENLDRAIAENWIKVNYQPIVRAVNGRVCDEEALSRWNDPVRGILSPADFIPALEDAGLIYRLDLYVLEQVLKKMTDQVSTGLYIVPHSINLSRADFDACDIVEEIRKRVDAAGVSRDKITIEITESVIGGDFDFMKGQVERFQKLGFPVWMDDFGSGYSSLDVLQSIQFDLIKFDMSFMRKMDAGASAKIILTELMKMATSLGVDTVCEGVETENQVQFLREIGCSKLQGFYYCKAIPLEEIVERNRRGIQIGYENPAESSYYETMGRINLYDLAVIANEGDSAFQNAFNTLPMGILEIKGDQAEYVRSSQSYRDFMMRFFGFDVKRQIVDFNGTPIGYGLAFMKAVEQCCNDGNRAFFDEIMPDGSKVHTFVRRIGVNPVNGNISIAIAVLSITEPDESTTYADIAQSLAADYYNIYLIDLDTNDYIEYSSKVGGEEMSLERHGEDFFESARRDTMTRIYEEDREAFLALFTKENVLRDIDRQGVFTTTYRLIDTGTPIYVNMKITRMHGGNRLILGVSIIDAHMKQKEEHDRVQEEKNALVRMMALSDDYLSLYIIDPETGHYLEQSASEEYESLGLAKGGRDFFQQARADAGKAFHPDDLPVFLQRFNREQVMKEIRENRVFKLQYRLMINGTPKQVSLRMAAYREGKKEKLVAGVRAWRTRREN